jgi:hypothetical protein
MVLGLVAKIYKYFNKFVPPCIAYTWLNVFMDDFEENYKIEKNENIKKIIDVIIIIIIYDSFIFF